MLAELPERIRLGSASVDTNNLSFEEMVDLVDFENLPKFPPEEQPVGTQQNFVDDETTNS
ncbi:hypothetical protein SESBI_42255 [Sesbania bispinosa]|nr:hypothetical protein SESBI_42255 [Sesbania bispinosa]